MDAKEVLIHMRAMVAAQREEHREYARAYAADDSISTSRALNAAERTIRAAECNAIIGMINIMMGGVA